MSRYEAKFEIDSKTEAHSVRLLMEQVYNTLREELREIDRGDAPKTETLRHFEALREATRDPSPGALTIIYESDDEQFDG